MRESVKSQLRAAGIYRHLRRTWRFLRGVPLRQYLRRRTIERFYAEIIAPGDLVFDVGANIGIRTAALRIAGAKVVAVEPQRACIETLRQRFGGDPLVVVEPVALGASEERLRLATATGVTTVASLAPRWPTESQFAAMFRDGTGEDVAVTTLDALIVRHGLPKFCKVDVEGYEPEVFAGLSYAISLIAFEYNCKFLDHVVKCTERLDQIGPVRFNYAPAETMRYALAEWTDGKAIMTHLKMQDPENGWGDVYAKFDHVR